MPLFLFSFVYLYTYVDRYTFLGLNVLLRFQKNFFTLLYLYETRKAMQSAYLEVISQWEKKNKFLILILSSWLKHWDQSNFSFWKRILIAVEHLCWLFHRFAPSPFCALPADSSREGPLRPVHVRGLPTAQPFDLLCHGTFSLLTTGEFYLVLQHAAYNQPKAPSCILLWLFGAWEQLMQFYIICLALWTAKGLDKPFSNIVIKVHFKVFHKWLF